jgi:hypothetical protein
MSNRWQIFVIKKQINLLVKTHFVFLSFQYINHALKSSFSKKITEQLLIVNWNKFQFTWQQICFFIGLKKERNEV